MSNSVSLCIVESSNNPLVFCSFTSLVIVTVQTKGSCLKCLVFYLLVFNLTHSLHQSMKSSYQRFEVSHVLDNYKKKYFQNKILLVLFIIG